MENGLCRANLLNADPSICIHVETLANEAHPLVNLNLLFLLHIEDFHFRLLSLTQRRYPHIMIYAFSPQTGQGSLFMNTPWS